MKKALAIGLPVVLLLVALVLLLPYNTDISQNTQVMCYSPTDQFVDREYTVAVEGKQVQNPVLKDKVKAELTLKQVGYNTVYTLDSTYEKLDQTYKDQPVYKMYGQSDDMDTCAIFFTDDMDFFLLYDSNKTGNAYITTDEESEFTDFYNFCADASGGLLQPLAVEAEE